MGLYVEFSITADWGFPEEVEGGNAMVGYESVPVDYSEACDAFVNTFLDKALALVPVDTGFLRSTIRAGTDGDMCWAEATADYAQYVEYGTSFMDAQPYFEPALTEACAEAQALAQQALQEAQDELADLLGDNASNMSMGGMGGGEGFGSFLGGLTMLALLAIIMAPFLLIAEGIKDVFNLGGSGRGGSAYIPEIEIT